MSRFTPKILGPRDVPLYPQKRTLLSVIGMSALCQKQTFAASFESRPRQLGNGAETVSRCGSTVQSLAFRQASQVFGIGGGSVPIRKEKSPRGVTSQPSR